MQPLDSIPKAEVIEITEIPANIKSKDDKELESDRVILTDTIKALTEEIHAIRDKNPADLTEYREKNNLLKEVQKDLDFTVAEIAERTRFVSSANTVEDAFSRAVDADERNKH